MKPPPVWRFNDPQLAFDLAHERAEVSCTLAGALAEHHRAGGERLTADDMLDPEVLASKAAGLIRRLAGQLELARTIRANLLLPEAPAFVELDPAVAEDIAEHNRRVAAPIVREAPRMGEPTCRSCGGRLMFSARERGDGLCGPCSRSTAAPNSRCGGMCWREGCGGQCHLSDGHKVAPCRCKSDAAGPPREPKVGDRVRITSYEMSVPDGATGVVTGFKDAGCLVLLDPRREPEWPIWLDPGALRVLDDEPGGRR